MDVAPEGAEHGKCVKFLHTWVLPLDEIGVFKCLVHLFTTPLSRPAWVKRESQFSLCPEACLSKGSGTEMHRKAATGSVDKVRREFVRGFLRVRRGLSLKRFVVTTTSLPKPPTELEDYRPGWVQSPKSRTSPASSASSRRFLSNWAGHLACDLGCSRVVYDFKGCQCVLERLGCSKTGATGLS